MKTNLRQIELCNRTFFSKIKVVWGKGIKQ